jgi:conjugative element/phage-associated large polyvalent protein
MQQPQASIIDWKRGDQPGAISRFVDGKRELWGLKKDAPEAVKRTFAQIEDIAKGDDVPAAGLVANILRGLNTPLRAGATVLSIPFQMRNMIRDAITVFIQHGFGALGDMPSSFWSRFRESPEWRQILREGGGFESLYNRTPADLERAIQAAGGVLIRDPTDLRQWLRRARESYLGLRPMSEAIEAMPRIAARRALLRKGMTPEEATLYGFRRSTVDWNRAGLALKQINPAILFINPRVQGMLNTGRILRDNPAARYRLAGLGATAITLALWNKQQPGYEDVPDYLKNQALIVMLPGAEQPEPNAPWQNLRFFAFPIGDFGAYTAPIRMLTEHFLGTDQRGPLEELSQELQAASPLPIPFVEDPSRVVGALLPAPLRAPLEIQLNRRFYSNIPIVPSSLQHLPTVEQIAPYTSAGSIWAANLAARLGHPVSPMALDFYVTENLGGLGQMLLGISDGMAGKSPDTLPVVGSIASGVYRTYGGQQQADRFDMATKLQNELEYAAVQAVKSMPEYGQATAQRQRQMLVAAQDELHRATQQAQGITPGAVPSDLGLPPKYTGVTAPATQREIDAGISAVQAYERDPLNNPFPSRQQLDVWAQYHGRVSTAYTEAVKARTKETDAVKGQVAQVVNNAPPPATGSDAEALQRAGALKTQLDASPRYINVRTRQAVGDAALWDQWDQWLARYNALPAKDPQHPWAPNPIKLQYRQAAQTLLAMQNQDRLRQSLGDADYQRYYGMGRGLSEEAWQKIRSTPKYKDLPAGSDAQAAARDAFLATYRKLPPRDPRRIQFHLQALRYQRQLNPAYREIVPVDRFQEATGVADLGDIETPAAA